MAPRLTRVDRQRLRWKPRTVGPEMLPRLQEFLVPIAERRLSGVRTLDPIDRVDLRWGIAELITLAIELVARRLRNGDVEFLHSPKASAQLARAVRTERGGLVRWLPILDSFQSTLISVAVAICIGYLRAQFPVLNPVTVAIAAQVLEAVVARRSDSTS